MCVWGGGGGGGGGVRFYGPVNPLGLCQIQSFYLTAQSSKHLTSTCAHSIAKN